MKSKTTITFLLSLFLSFQVQSVEIGDKAPDFTLKGHDKKDHKLSDHKGKWVVLEWFNQGCPFVKKHYDSSNMQTLQKTYTGKNVVWFTIVSSASGKQGHLTQEEAAKVVEEKSMKATALLLDPEGKVGQSYEAKTTPHMYIVDPQGHLVYQGAIDSEATVDTSDIKDAKNYVAQGLDQGLKGEKILVAKTKPYGCSVKY